jgi:hypothetical protein
LPLSTRVKAQIGKMYSDQNAIWPISRDDSWQLSACVWMPASWRPAQYPWRLDNDSAAAMHWADAAHH